MAEIVINIHSNITYDPDDIMCAFNDNRISKVHVDMLCNIRDAGFTSDGLRPTDCLSKHLAENTHQFAFFRVSQKEIVRVNLFTDEVDTLSDVPNEKNECIHVDEFLKRRVKHNRHAIFGSKGSEFWFGGNKRFDPEKLGNVWNILESKTDYRREDFTFFPLSQIEKRRFLSLGVTDFPDKDKALLEADLALDKDKHLKKRLCNIHWQDIFDFSDKQKNQISDTNIETDIRQDFQFVWNDIVDIKGLRK